MDFKTYLNFEFIQELQSLTEVPEIAEAVKKFKKLGGLDPASFIEICCKYIREGRAISTFYLNPIRTCIIMDLNKLWMAIASQSEDIMWDIDSGMEKKYQEDNEFMRKYLEWEGQSPIIIAYHEALIEYKKSHPSEYFSGVEESCGGLATATSMLFKICERILLEKFK